jgi:hypothetical protein
MELLGHESYQVKEVFAYFELAMYQAQCLERGLGIALATVYGPGPKKITKAQYDELLESNFQKTLGELVNRIRRSVKIPGKLENTISEALKERNRLAHNYFWEKAVAFTKEDGRQTMIEELREIADFLEATDSELSAIVLQFGEKHGITKETMDRLVKKAYG